MDYIKLGLFKIIKKNLKVTYKLDLPLKIKIYPVQHIAILKPVYSDIKPLLYKIDTYRGQKINK